MKYLQLVLIFASLLPCQVIADDVFLTKDEALSLVLGRDCRIEYEKKTLPKDLITTLKENDLEPEDDCVSHVFRCLKNNQTTGYAFIDSQIGKHLPITFIVGITPQGQVSRVEIMVYRESFGSQVKDPKFTKQFENKTAADILTGTLIVGAGIKHMTGATLSSKAISVGVRRNLEIFRYYYQKVQ